ncbi:hypothetical protein DERP_001710 [Dermatophagoides pteronyssinus]|uniref:CCHC-type domain-containing protein n=2 Tax=Dermatophagoides pteronyssinus TaxID=6956 RepID=A0ABQ8JBF4_DERPT|nr:hypothetical protein DERP_001710 [Dermatophagoides pteronyssinus]
MDQKDEKLIQMPKLDKTSFNDWRDILTDVLESLKLAKFVEESSYVGTAEFSVDVLAKIARVKTIIKTSISIEDRQLIRSCSNPVEMLKELDQKYRGPCAKSAWELLVDWDDVTFDGSVSGLFSKLRELFVQFEEKDLVLPRYFINAKVRKLLPPEYDECRRLLMVYNGGRVESEYMTDKQFEAEILKFERDLKSKSLRDSTALVSVSKKKQYVFRGKCNFCGIPGHVSRDCRQKQKSSEKNAKSGKTECHSKSKQEKEQAELVISSALVKSASVPDSSIRFIADCGASYHVVNDKSILTNVRRTVGKINTISGIIEDPDQGDLLCEFFNGSFWRPCKVKDVFFVPDQPFNLVSLGKMCKNNGFRNVMDEEKLVIYNNNDPVLVGNWSKHYQNIMELQIRIKRSSIVNTAVVQSLSCWHERFGHFSAAQIAKMIRQNRVDGIPVKLQNDMGFCTSCQIGKATDVSHPLEDENENIKVGMKLHLDIGGYTTPSIHGNRYFLLAVDHRSRYLKLGFMKDRSHTLDLFKRYQGLSIYRVYIPDKHRIELASSVKFDEKPTCNVDSFVKSVSTSDTEDVLVDINVPIPSDGGHVSDNVTASRGRGRPVGSTNRVYQRNEERVI